MPGRVSRILILTLSALVAWSSTASAQGPRLVRAASAGEPAWSRADLVRVRRLLAEPVGWARHAAVAGASQAAQDGQETSPDDGPPSSAGGRKAGAIVALVAGIGLFGFFLSRGPKKVDDTIELRGEGDEIADFTILAGAMTLIGAGVLTLMAGS